MNTDPGYVISALVVFSLISFGVFALSRSSEKKEKPQNEKDAAAIELLKGGNAGEIASREGVSVEELEKWKNEFLDSALDFAKNKNAYLGRVSERENEIKWFEQVCEKHIGGDWKKITNYDRRNR